MAGIDIGIEFDTVVLDHILSRVDNALDVAVEMAADAVKERAQNRVPVRTGLLKISIAKGREAAGVWFVNAAMYYAVFVEFGTSKMAAQPFMIPAVSFLPWGEIKATLLKELGI